MDKYKLFHTSIMKQIETLMEQDPPIGSEEGNVLVALVEIIAHAEQDAGWMNDDSQFGDDY